jgi:type I restriction enzyme S subunit
MVKENALKQTEIGLLPDEWRIGFLYTITDLVTDGAHLSPPTSRYGFPIVTVENINKGYINLASCRIISEKDYLYLVRNSCKPINGDVLLSKDGTIGITFTIKDNPNVVLLSSIALIRPNKSLLNSEYLSQVLSSHWFYIYLNRVQGGSALTRIVLRDIKNFYLALPPLPEQEVIAEALSDADAWIESLKQLIAKKRLIKQGAMQELLSPNEDWEVKKLGEVTIDGGLIRGPFGGALKKEFFVKNGYKVYEQKNAIYKSVHLGKYFVDTAKFKELGRFEIKANDFILSCSGTIGKLFRIPQIFQKGIINQALLIIRLNSTIIDFGYFGHIFQYDTIQSKIIDDTQGGAMKNLVGMSEFRNTEIPIPSLTEQIRIATILSDMDAELEALKGQLGKARKVKQGMMQELLTGRTRLI